MQYVRGDLLSISEGVIAHQTNLYGSMGGGVALALATKYPTLQNIYGAFCKKNKVKLGQVQHVHVSDDLTIANCFSQQLMPIADNGQPVPPKFGITSYDSIIRCFEYVDYYRGKCEVYVPYLYGCGIAGGKWEIVLAILKEFDFKVVVRYEDLAKVYGDNDKTKESFSKMAEV